MSIKKVTAIIDNLQISRVEEVLKQHGVTGFTLHPVRGRGYYSNLYSEDGLVDHQQLEIYTSSQYAEKIAQLIVETTYLDGAGQGIVAINSIDTLYGVSHQKKIDESSFKFFENI
jgi:nitrogen regulatory protein P-II 1